MPPPPPVVFPCPSWCAVGHDPDEPGEHESRPIAISVAAESSGEPYVMIVHSALDADAPSIYVGDGFDAHIDLPAERFEAMIAAYSRRIQPVLAG
jgi:hypothetical protein